MSPPDDAGSAPGLSLGGAGTAGTAGLASGADAASGAGASLAGTGSLSGAAPGTASAADRPDYDTVVSRLEKAEAAIADFGERLAKLESVPVAVAGTGTDDTASRLERIEAVTAPFFDKGYAEFDAAAAAKRTSGA